MKPTKWPGSAAAIVGMVVGATLVLTSGTSGHRAAAETAYIAGPPAAAVSGEGMDGHFGRAGTPLTPQQIEAGLRIIQEAGTGVGSQVIVGADGRTQIHDTAASPYRSIVQIVKFVGDEPDSTCSGAFVAPDVVLTAAHCVQEDAIEPEATDFLLVPGEDGLTFPYGATISIGWVYHQAWEDSGYDDALFDIALIRTADPLGSIVGNLGTITALSEADLKSAALNPTSIGYPSDKTAGTMWRSSTPALREVYTDLISYDLDVFFGQSGSAIYRGADRRIFSVVAQGCVVANQPCGFIDGKPAYNNFSVRITQEVAAALAAFCLEMGCELNYEVPAPGNTTPTVTPSATATSPKGPKREVVAPGLAKGTGQ